MIIQFFSNSMIFPCMELFFHDFPGFPGFPELVGILLDMVTCRLTSCNPEEYSLLIMPVRVSGSNRYIDNSSKFPSL